jgi:hypothetical protein
VDGLAARRTRACVAKRKAGREHDEPPGLPRSPGAGEGLLATNRADRASNINNPVALRFTAPRRRQRG